MPRRASKNHRREVQPDAVYNNRLVTQLINKVLLDGKKATAERIVYGAFDIVAEKSGEDALSVFKKAMDNIRPTLEVKPKRVGGATYQVPIEVRPDRRQTLGLRWLTAYSRSRSERIIHNFESFNIHGYDIEILIRILFQYLICLFIKGFFTPFL